MEIKKIFDLKNDTFYSFNNVFEINNKKYLLSSDGLLLDEKGEVIWENSEWRASYKLIYIKSLNVIITSEFVGYSGSSGDAGLQ